MTRVLLASGASAKQQGRHTVHSSEASIHNQMARIAIDVAGMHVDEEIDEEYAADNLLAHVPSKSDHEAELSHGEREHNTRVSHEQQY